MFLLIDLEWNLSFMCFPYFFHPSIYFYEEFKHVNRQRYLRDIHVCDKILQFVLQGSGNHSIPFFLHQRDLGQGQRKKSYKKSTNAAPQNKILQECLKDWPIWSALHDDRHQTSRVNRKVGKYWRISLNFNILTTTASTLVHWIERSSILLLQELAGNVHSFSHTYSLIYVAEPFI